tara:strand:- start:719 stop:1471 length:753 start_codon:yes stop_codon:yes gene_type:complete
MDLVSIVIPYFRKKKYIKNCIKSILNQTYRNFEIIIIYDDKDKTDLSFVMNLVKRDRRINLILNNISLGAGLSRNKGIKFSKGKFIAFLDADDYWNKNKLRTQLKFMNRNNYLVSHTSYQIINEKGKIISNRKARSFFEVNDLLYSCDIGLSTVILKKNILSKNLKFPNIKTKEDFVLWLFLLKKKIPINGLNKNLMYWRKLDNSLSSSLIQKMSDGFKVYYKYMDFGLFRSIFNLFCLSINFVKKIFND